MENQPPTTIKTIFREIWKGILPHKRLFWIAIATYTLFELVKMVIPIFYKIFFDMLGRPQTAAEDLVKIIIFIAGMNFLDWGLRAVASFSLNTLEPKVMATLKQNSFDYLMLHSRNFFVNNFAGALVQKINRFARAFESLMDIAVFNFIPLVIAITGAIIVTAFIDPLISAVLAGWTAAVIAANLFFSRWKMKFDIDAAAADSKTTGMLSDSIMNYLSVKLLNGYRREVKNFKEVSGQQAQKTELAWQLSTASTVFQHLLIYLIEFFAFYYVIGLWKNGQAAIGTFVLIQTYIINISEQLWGVARMFRGTYQAMADSKEMAEIMALPHEIKDPKGAQDLQITSGQIEFKEVTFGFQGDRNILQKLNLKISGGEKAAIVGPSGTGKTTLTGLLLRLFNPNEGEILIDKQNIAQATQESLRQNISLVPQDPVLFHRSIMENIRYGRPKASDQEVIEAAKLAHCDEFVQRMPAGYQTLVGERGVKLSGGERQRIAIARAILKNAPILVLDEATSSLDSESEKLIQDALETLMENRTTIAIAHRLSTIRKMDRVIVIKDGGVAEEGTHQGLTRKKHGIYRKLWNLQAGGFIE